MNVVHQNRISDLLEPTPIPRTEAQRAASRKNGSKSNGPVSAAGKARSRMNSLRHGLLARVVIPTADAREHDRLYRQARAGLHDQFQPVTFTDCLTIDSLASDLVNLARARRMIEAMHRPTSQPSPANVARWESYVKTKQDCRLFPACINRLDAGMSACTSEAMAKRIAESLAEAFEGATNLLSDAAVIEGDEDPVPEDLEDLRRAQELFKKLKKPPADFGKAERLAEMLLRRPPAPRADQRRLRLLLEYISILAIQWLRDNRNIKRELAKPHDDGLAALARTPIQVEQLLLLDRYRASLESAIERKLWQLGQR